MERKIKVFDFVRVRGKGIRVVTNIKDDKAIVVGIGLSEDEDTIICRSSIHNISELEYISETMINVAGPLWLIRDELTEGSFERMVYDEKR